MRSDPEHVIGAIRQVLDVGEPIVISVRHDLEPYQQRLLASLGAGYVVDAAAPPCAIRCGHQECAVTQTQQTASGALPLGMASLGLGATRPDWQPNWIDYRHSVANVDWRRDQGEIPKVCDACGCEVDVDPAPHSPKCPTLARAATWTADSMLEAVAGWVQEKGDAPFASDWGSETRSHPSARQVVVEFGSWGAFLDDAGLEPKPRAGGRRLGGAEDGRELLDRMDAGEPVGLEETAAVGKRADSGAAPLLVGEPERAAVSSSSDDEETGPAEERPDDRGGDADATGAAAGAPAGGARKRSKWTPDVVVAAIRRWADEHDGQPPTQRDWHRRGDYYPAFSSAAKAFGGSWSAAVRAAGLEPRKRGSQVGAGVGHLPVARPDHGRPVGSWSPVEALDAIRRWAAEHGAPPTSSDWMKQVDGYPPTATVKRLFGSWAEAIEQAGFERPTRGGRRSAADPPAERPVRVRGTGLTYRSVTEALIAADEIEADGDRVADQARFDGNDAKADEAGARSRDLAEKIRAAAAAVEARHGSGREPEAEPAVEPQSDHSLQAASASAEETPEPPSRPSPALRSPPAIDEVGLVPLADLHQRSDAWLAALHAEADRLELRAGAYRKIADGLAELVETERPKEVV